MLSLTDVGVDVGVPEGVLVGVDVGVYSRIGRTNEQVQVSCHQFNNQQMDTKLKTKSSSYYHSPT